MKYQYPKTKREIYNVSVLTGWGATIDWKERYARRLMQVKLQVIPQPKCRQISYQGPPWAQSKNFRPWAHLCAGYMGQNWTKRKGACNVS